MEKQGLMRPTCCMLGDGQQLALESDSPKEFLAQVDAIVL